MRALRVVGITEGGGELSVVLEDSLRRERFTVPADEQLRAAARGDLTRLGQIAIELESQLRPREIQARIRAGASVEQVAAAAGVPLQKIERFAYPVLLERSRTAEVAQRAHPMRAEGPDSRMLGDVVAHTFGLRGQEYSATEWDSWKGEDGRWVVALSWRAGRSDNRALWTFQPGAHGGTVTAVDEHAHDLVEGLPARPLRTVGPVIDISRPDEQAPAPEEGHELRAAASDIAARRDVSDWSRTAPEPRRPEPPRRSAPPTRQEPAETLQRSGRVEEPPAPQESGRGSAGPARPDRETQLDQATRPDRETRAAREAQPATDWPAAPEAEGRGDAQAAVPAEADTPADVVPSTTDGADIAANSEQPGEPAPEAPAPRQAEPETAAGAPAVKRNRKGKPVMPSWDEVLLGVRGQR
ncbi:MAG TPA: septation protein SepH [Pseudonocardia sp.]